jgi:hypothetical protein
MVGRATINGMADFWLHESPARDRARIHRSSCADCNDGKGAAPKDSDADGRWLPFDSRADATAEAKRLGIEDSKAFPDCLPDSGGKSW